MTKFRDDIPDAEKLVALLQADPERAMPALFECYYHEVCNHIYRLIPVRQTCEDIAQSIFYELWKKRASLDIHTSAGAYLHRMALTRALNYIRDQRKYAHEGEEHLVRIEQQGANPIDLLAGDELQKVIDAAIDALPLRCRQVFMLSRFESMTYHEIAIALGISEKTVENQISKALRILRDAVREHHRG